MLNIVYMAVGRIIVIMGDKFQDLEIVKVTEYAYI
jgi:hypothetical protein